MSATEEADAKELVLCGNGRRRALCHLAEAARSGESQIVPLRSPVNRCDGWALLGRALPPSIFSDHAQERSRLSTQPNRKIGAAIFEGPVMQKKSSSRDPKRGSLSKEKYNLLRKISIRYHNEAEKCASVRAYYAACVMIGAALEAMLLQMCDLFEDEVAQAVLKLPRKPKGSIEHWGLDDLIEIAVAVGWLPTRRGLDLAEPGIGELAHLIRRLRNLSHPGVHLREVDEVPLRAASYRVAYALYDSVRDWLWIKFAQGAPMEPNRSPFGPPNRVVVKVPRPRRKRQKSS
jgi:hypothetical protein